MNEDKKPKLSIAGDVLQAIFENGKSPLSTQYLRWKIWKKWSDFVGPSISQVSEPVSYQKGVLHVWVKNASWMQQLVFMRDTMRDAINKKLGIEYVKDIRLTLDRKFAPKDQIEADALKESMNKVENFSKNNKS